MRRTVLVILVVGGIVTIGQLACDSEDSAAEPWNYGGSSDSGHDAGTAGAAGSTDGSSSGGWTLTGGTSGASGHAGSAGMAGSAGAQAAGAAGSATGGAAGTAGSGGETCEGQGGSGGPCDFPQGVPDPDFFCAASSYQDTDPAVDAAVNAAMATLSGCDPMSDCIITGIPGTTVEEICQGWFAAVTQRLRDEGYCAGQHITGHTDEIAVSNTGCTGKWYGYHVCNYGGGKVAWNPGARRGWWMIEPSYCPP